VIHEPRHTDCDVSCTACDWYSSEPGGVSWTEHLPDSLDAAWAEAEAALPERACGLSITAQGDWGVVRNWAAWAYAPGEPTITGNGPTPAAALRALAARLRERAG
jgi:hypothetical protein